MLLYVIVFHCMLFPVIVCIVCIVCIVYIVYIVCIVCIVCFVLYCIQLHCIALHCIVMYVWYGMYVYMEVSKYVCVYMVLETTAKLQPCKSVAKPREYQ